MLVLERKIILPRKKSAPLEGEKFRTPARRFVVRGNWSASRSEGQSSLSRFQTLMGYIFFFIFRAVFRQQFLPV